jgi:hypothetical protein
MNVRVLRFFHRDIFAFFRRAIFASIHRAIFGGCCLEARRIDLNVRKIRGEI